MSQPGAATEPRAHTHGKANDRLARGYLFQYIDPRERALVKDTTMANACRDTLKDRHAKEGPVRQLQLLTEVPKTSVSRDKPLPEAAAAMHDLVKRAFTAGDLTCNVGASLAFLHGMDSPKKENFSFE